MFHIRQQNTVLSQIQRFILAIFFSISVFSLASSASAQAAGISITSENFVLKGDISEREGKRLVKELEIFRRSLFKMVGQEYQTEENPVKVFAFRNVNHFQSVVNNKTAAGVYRPTSNGAVFVLNAQGGFKEGSEARRVAFHEFVHHIIATYTGQKFPRWYNEGYANFLANFKIKKNKFIIGAPDSNYAWYVKNQSWMSMDVLIASVNRYPFISGSSLSSQKNMQHAFYSQSWLAVTYLQTHPEYARKSGEYLARVNKGEDSLEAFKASMGMTPDEFGEIIRNFSKKGVYKHYPFPIDRDALNPYMDIQKLQDVEFNLALSEAIKLFK